MAISHYAKTLAKRMVANIVRAAPIATRFDNHQNTYKMTPYPSGWYSVCLSQELSTNKPKPLSFFGKELVAFRGHANKASILDAHCPHMGAHLGHLGRVQSGALVCPFHGWSFDKTGQCTNAPFAKKTPCFKKASLYSYETVEKNGMVFMWFHQNRRPPFFEAPEFPENNQKPWTTAKSFSMIFRSHVQEIRENFCDETHFHYVHRQPGPSQIIFESNGATAKVKSKLVAFGELGLKNLPTLDTEATMHGPGIMAVRTTGVITATSIALTTPINEEYVDFRLLTYGKKPKFFPALGHIFKNAQDFYAFNDLLFEGAIWNHKIYKVRPLLQQSERTIPKFRKWYEQFYQD